MKTVNECKQKKVIDRILVMACLSAVIGLTGCQKEGTAEKAGQKIDRAAEDAGQKIDAAKESLDQKSEQAKDYINESTDASKREMENTGKKIEQVTENAESKIEGAKESIVDKAQTAGDYIGDSVITAEVKAAILKEPTLSASRIEVTTVNGVVSLSGTVDSEQGIGKAAALAGSQKNVKSVQNDLIINMNAPAPK
jgi:hyperosmotically inducible protein